MRVGFVVDWNTDISSLMVLARNMFRELAKLMNEKKSFTITAISKNFLGIGDINQHFDLIHFPNLGGYTFPNDNILNAKNVILSPSGIDEVIYREQVFPDKKRWPIIERVINKEVPRWKQNIDKIKAVHVVTKSELNEMNEYLGVPLEKMTIIPHGVNHDVFVPTKNKDELKNKIYKNFQLEEQDYFIHISERNWARKNIPRILEAFSEAKKCGLTQNLILVGKVHPFVIKKVKNISGVKIMGWVSEEHLIELIQGSHGIILPSIHEGFGLPLVECMACGIPSITSNKHGPPEVVGNSGILVDPYNIMEIKDAILELGKNKELHSKLSKNALIRSKDFSWKNTASSLLQLYEKIVTPQNSWNFENSFEVSARRTLTTVCQLFPQKDDENPYAPTIPLIDALLSFNYKKMIDWALQYGLTEPKTRDFLLPLETWLRNKSEIKY